MTAKQSMMLATTLLTACSSLGASGCAHSQVPRPDIDVCEINVPSLHKRCFNLRDDYDDNGMLKPGARAHYLPCPGPQPCYDPETRYQDAAAMLADLNKNVSTDPDGWASLKAYIRDLRAEQAQ